MPRSGLRPPRLGPPDGGSALGCGWPASIGPARGSVAPAISRKRVWTSRGEVYPPRGARGVRKVARDAVAAESLRCDTSASAKLSALAQASHEVGRRTEE